MLGTDQSPWAADANGLFPDPFSDVSSQVTPYTMPRLLRWCEHIVGMANGVYRAAIDRILSYFITDIEITGVDDEEKDRYYEYLQDVLGIQNVLHTVGLDLETYGNSFISVQLGFRRFLSCPKCHIEHPLRTVYESPQHRFRWQDFQFFAHCPHCHFEGAWRHIDRRVDAEDRIKVKRWSPHEIELIWDPFSNDVRYVWKIPDYYKRLVAEGNIFHLERANWEIIEAIRDRMWFQFAEDAFFHLKNDTLAGVHNRGWGISRVLSNFKQIWYVQVLHRFNEAIALDYVIPFRVITPSPGAGGGGDPSMKDPIMNMNLGGFTSRVQRMLKIRRKDPASWHVLPFPVQYQVLGGDAKALAPKELVDQGLEVLLNNLGMPVELYRGTLQLQSTPASLRLFEANHAHIVYNLNQALAFIVRRISTLLSWEPATVRLQRVTMADDLQRQLAKLQLMLSGKVSDTTGLKSVGVDFREEIQRTMDDERFKAEQQQELQETMERAGLLAQMQQGVTPGMPGAPGAPGEPGAAPGAPPAGGMPGAAPMPGTGLTDMALTPNQSVTPQELMDKATALAQELLAMSESQRFSEMVRIKRVNPTLHSITTAVIKDIRQQARTAGGQMVLQQQFGGS